MRLPYITALALPATISKPADIGPDSAYAEMRAMPPPDWRPKDDPDVFNVQDPLDQKAPGGCRYPDQHRLPEAA